MGVTRVSSRVPAVTHRVTVLTGGSTPERDVALAGGAQVVAALREEGHTVSVVDTVSGPLSASSEADLLTGAVDREPPTLNQLEALRREELGPRLTELPEVREADVVFLVLHGRQGEGGELQALLDLAGVPYIGSDALGSGIAMAKDIAKRLMQHAGITTPDWVMWPSATESIDALGWPLIVKPSRVGSTVGLSVVDTPDDLRSAVELAKTHDDDVMIEQLIRGREFTVGILGDEALAVGEIIPQHDIFDYECKYTPGMTQEIFPADLPSETTATIQASAAKTHCVLKLRDMSRVDFILSPAGNLHCLEANTLPGLTSTSLLPQSAKASGIGFRQLCTTLCDLAVDRCRGTKARARGF